MAFYTTDDAGVTVVTRDQSGYALECYGTVSPTTLDTTNTYQKGCVYIKTDGTRYVNTGTLVAPLFAPQGIQTLSQTVTRAQFTDGGAAAGTLNLTGSIPLGAVVTRTTVTGVTGFTGDTSAVITVGDGTDVDRYNTGTPSVFTTIAAIDAGAVSGTAFHSAAKTPVLTVTSASDFTAVAAGALTVTIYYYV